MGIIFNTRDVGACLAEVKGASAMMWVLFLIPVCLRDIVLILVPPPNSAGIIFNTHDVGACLSEVKGASAMMRVLFLIPVMWGRVLLRKREYQQCRGY